MFFRPCYRFETGCAAYVFGCGSKCERENAAQLRRSVLDKVLALPDDLEVYPAHFAGSASGAGMSGKPASTIAFEKKWNSLLALDETAFVEQVGAAVPPKPEGMPAIMRFNSGRA